MWQHTGTGQTMPCVKDPRVDIYPCWATGSLVKDRRRASLGRALRRRMHSLTAHRRKCPVHTDCLLPTGSSYHLSTRENFVSCPNAQLALSWSPYGGASPSQPPPHECFLFWRKKNQQQQPLLNSLTFTVSSTQPSTGESGGLPFTALPGTVRLLSGRVTGHQVFSHLQKNRFAWQCPEGVLYCHNLMLTLGKSAALSMPPCALATYLARPSPACLEANKKLGPGMYLLTLFP